MIRSLIAFVSFFVLSASAYAKAPSILPVQGYIADDSGKALEGDSSLVFTLYTNATGGTALYQETQTISFRGGHFFGYVGDAGTLDLSIFKDNDSIYLGVKIGNDAEMQPRILLASSAYAAYAENAGNAENLDGKAAADYALKADTMTLAWNKIVNVLAGLADGIDNDTTYTTAAPLTMNGTQIGISPCAEGEVLKQTGTGWGCGPDADTMSNLNCAEGEMVQRSLATALGWTCVDHAGNPNAHHSSTSDGLALTPASVTIQGTSTTLNNGAIDLGPASDDSLTAAMVQTLTGGGDADALHSHAAQAAPAEPSMLSD